MIVAGTPKHVGGCVLASAIPDEAIVPAMRTPTDATSAIRLAGFLSTVVPAAFGWPAPYMWCCVGVSAFHLVTISSRIIAERIQIRTTPAVMTAAEELLEEAAPGEQAEVDGGPAGALDEAGDAVVDAGVVAGQEDDAASDGGVRFGRRGLRP
ncbi:hypothetical protein [Nonomuraea dietziae]|uniref:hypothetical protein n=1 Tax=Nonomuraea dietziae TaxID=65515 RepID=UPI003449CA13